MLKMVSTVAALLIGFQAYANPNTATITTDVVNAATQVASASLGWEIGDSADYTVKGGFINGTMNMFVREKVDEGTWIQQDMDLGFLGKQKVEILYSAGGKVLALIVNGEKQTPPSADDQEIVETREESMTVPKGTFNCIYVKIKDKKSGQISEAWVDPVTVPVAGMVKTLAPSQIGTITIELTNYKKM